MPDITQADLDAVGTKIKAMRDDVLADNELVKQGLKSESEKVTAFEKKLDDITKTIDDLRRLIPDPMQLTQRQGDAATQKGGIFEGEPTLSYLELLSIDPRSNVLRGSDVDQMKSLHDANDAVAIQLAMRANKWGPEEAVKQTSKVKDYQRLNRNTKHAGYGDDYFKDTMMHPSSGGAGAPLTTTILSSSFFEEVRLSLRVSNQFPVIPLVNNKQDFPIQRGYPIGVRGGVATTDPPPRAEITTPWPGASYFTSVSFGLVSFNVVDVLGYMWFNDHMLTDTILPWLPFMRNQIAFAIARARDRACMDGDIQGRTAGAHMDDWQDNFPTNDARTLWNGMRRLATNYTLSNAGNVFDVDAFRAGRKKMGIYGQDQASNVCWTTIGSWYNLIHDPDMVTVDKIGIDRATIRTGTQGFVDNCPIIPVEWVSEALDANGVVVSGGTLTAAILADTSRFLLGSYGVVSIEMTRVAPMLANIIQGHVREDFVPLEAIDGNKIFAAGASASPVVVVRNCAK